MEETFGLGFLAALTLPSGVEEGVMDAAVVPEVEIERTVGRGGSSEDVEAEASGRTSEGGGEEGDSRGLSESKLLSGVEAIMAVGVYMELREGRVLKIWRGRSRRRYDGRPARARNAEETEEGMDMRVREDL